MNKACRIIVASLLSCYLSLYSLTLAAASEEFIVHDIKVLGLQRVSLGTVLNYLPVQIGEEIGPSSTAEIIKALYETGFFQDVSLERQGNTLLVKVLERATIGEISLTGNSEIPTDKLKALLKELGLVKGRVFQRSAMENIVNQLKQAYNERGKYNALITTKVTALTENRVAVRIDISEGRVSRIREIRITGNHDFSSNELLGEMSLSTSSIFTYFTKKDQYSKPAMDASLESIRTFYLDRGYLQCKILSSQVMLSPDRRDVYIHIHVEEGPQFRFSGFAIVGNTILPKEKIAALVKIKTGQVFSRELVTKSISNINLTYGDAGYGFPTINAEPRIEQDNRTVFITFIVEPGRHVYVRRIHFHGNTKTADYVLRNAIRQDEGSLLSLHNIQESERHLRLLGYLKDINFKTTPVPGTNNQVDLDVQVAEAPSAEAGAAVGFGSNSFNVNASLTQHNFMGTGRSVGFNFNASKWGQDYAFNYYNPFYSNTGIGRGFSVYYQTTSPRNLDVANYTSDKVGGQIDYNITLSDNSSVQLGYGFQNLYIKSPGRVNQIQNFVSLYGNHFNQIRLNGGWARNTYDRMPFPTNGSNQQLTALIALPATHQSLSYYKTGYTIHSYLPLTKGFILSFLGNVNYGNGFKGQALPFFENYYAGGIAQPGQVRGFSSFSLGPQDNYLNAIGGNFLINSSLGLILPSPISRDNVRTSLFVDTGNVFASSIAAPLTGLFQGPMRFSAGLSVEWRSPFGLLAFSLAKPINKQPTDKTEYFQFSVSSGF